MKVFGAEEYWWSGESLCALVDIQFVRDFADTEACGKSRITHILKNLHWLPVYYCPIFKTAKLAYN